MVTTTREDTAAYRDRATAIAQLATALAHGRMPGRRAAVERLAAQVATLAAHTPDDR